MIYYIKGYYGYKNFGDEVLIFGVINYLERYFPVEKYVIEVDDVLWMYTWVQKHKDLLVVPIEQITFVPIKKDRYKWITHIKTIFGYSKYRQTTKVFGGGELFDFTKSFPHNGRNLLFLFFRTIIKKNYILLGGIGTPTGPFTRFLQKILLSRAKKIVCRDEISYQTASKYAKKENIILHRDFAYDVLDSISLQEESGKKVKNKLNFLINTPYSPSIAKLIKKYSHKKYIFFPCEYSEDNEYYCSLAENIPQIQSYDWTQYTLYETIQLFKNSSYGVGRRLHFCLMLEYYAIAYSVDKISEKHKKNLPEL